MDILTKTIINLLELYEEFKKDKIVELQLISSIDIIEQADFTKLVNELKKIKTIQEIVQISKSYSNEEKDYILIYWVITKAGYQYVTLIEDLEELYTFHRVISIIKVG